VVDYLKAQVLTAEKRYTEALAVLAGVSETQALLLQRGDLYLRLRRWRDAQQVYERALAADPDHPQAYVGLCRVALGRRKFDVAVDAALDALERVHDNPLAHFLLGSALTGLREFERAADAFRAAISFNPNFPEAHVRLAALLEKHLSDPESAREHRRLARRMRSAKPREPVPIADAPFPSQPIVIAPPVERVPLAESLIVVTGLPRSGTSMIMQMLAAGGIAVMSDGLRAADEDNPRGYLEFEPVKNLLRDSKWLDEVRGKAIKILTPVLSALPRDLICRVILCERDLDEVLDSQERMLARLKQTPAATPERRGRLKDEYARTLTRVKAMLTRRPKTDLLVLEHRDVISNPTRTAEKMSQFLDGNLDPQKMADAVDPSLHHNRAHT